MATTNDYLSAVQTFRISAETVAEHLKKMNDALNEALKHSQDIRTTLEQTDNELRKSFDAIKAQATELLSKQFP